VLFWYSLNLIRHWSNSNSSAAATIKDDIIQITEEVKGQEKEARIRRAPTSGQITLLTRCFGRGTDFVCHDQTVSANGGVHVVQTFLSEELSEEIQIKGRTARQGGVGSFSMVLLDTSLEKVLVTKENLEEARKGAGGLMSLFKSNSLYDFLNKKRINFFKDQYNENTKFLAQVKKHHEEAIKFLDSLHAGCNDEVQKFLMSQNKGTVSCARSKTIVLMDATGSMANLLHKAKTTVGLMFERTQVVLKENGLQEDSFQLQFVFYRNYSSSEDKLLQASTWETRPENLRAFTETVNVEGGLGREAVEIGLWHANKEHEKEKISQVILIGDAPANTDANVTAGRILKGEKYWQTTKFAQRTNYTQELKKLQDSNVPIHTFYVASWAKDNFKEIAGSTGRCEALDINSEKGAETLTTLVTEEILRNVGQSNGKGDALVDAYRAKFGKSYT